MDHPQTTKKLETPSECETEEFTRFKELAKQLVSIPKKDIKKQEGKTAKQAPRRST